MKRRKTRRATQDSGALRRRLRLPFFFSPLSDGGGAGSFCGSAGISRELGSPFSREPAHRRRPPRAQKGEDGEEEEPASAAHTPGSRAVTSWGRAWPPPSPTLQRHGEGVAFSHPPPLQRHGEGVASISFSSARCSREGTASLRIFPGRLGGS